MENPGAFVKYYGYLNDQPNPLPALGSNVEASKTEPDKNTYLVLPGLNGADPDYDKGTHFLFQGHEAGSPGSITGDHPSPHGLLGAKRPHPFQDGWRAFYTGQHGENITWEIVRAPGHGDGDDDDHGDHEER